MWWMHFSKNRRHGAEDVCKCKSFNIHESLNQHSKKVVRWKIFVLGSVAHSTLLVECITFADCAIKRKNANASPLHTVAKKRNFDALEIAVKMPDVLGKCEMRLVIVVHLQIDLQMTACTVVRHCTRRSISLLIGGLRSLPHLISLSVSLFCIPHHWNILLSDSGFNTKRSTSVKTSYTICKLHARIWCVLQFLQLQEPIAVFTIGLRDWIA